MPASSAGGRAHLGPMRTERIIAWALLLAGLACTMEHSDEHPVSVARRIADGHARTGEGSFHSFDVGIFQRTCALFVGLRTGALESPAVFGNEPAEGTVHWNKCPGGTLVACKVVATANGDTVITGIPLVH